MANGSTRIRLLHPSVPGMSVNKVLENQSGGMSTVDQVVGADRIPIAGARLVLYAKVPFEWYPTTGAHPPRSRHAPGGCAEALVRHLDIAFAGFWTLNVDSQILELQASAGIHTHRDGPHGRVPVGSMKNGLIAQKKKPYCFTSPGLSITWRASSA